VAEARTLPGYPGATGTGGKAEQIASERARLEVVAARVPVCLEQSDQDAVSASTLASLMEVRPHRRDRILMDAAPNSAVARACIQELAARF
jgi:hypothetical protein